MWQDLFDLALQESLSTEDLAALAYRVAGEHPVANFNFQAIDGSVLEDLSSKKRYQDAARVLLDYAGDVREGIIALVQGNSFSEARRVVCFCIVHA